MTRVNRRELLLGSAGALWLPPSSAAPAPPPLEEPHFPDRLHQYVWRNWELVNVDRMAAVVKAAPKDILGIGDAMGLGQKPVLSPDQLRRIYITVIRQNWHLLPNDQLVELLGWTHEKLVFTLREDDFLDVKLGPKPDCKPVHYQQPSPQARQRAAEIKRIVRMVIGKELEAAGEPPFQFVERLSSLRFPALGGQNAKPAPGQVDVSGWSIRADSGGEVAGRLKAFLMDSFGAKPDQNDSKAITLRVDPGLESEAFRAIVEDGRITVSGANLAALFQAVYWLEDEMELNGGPLLNKGNFERKAVFNPRHLYSYFALYGDPLLEPETDPFPGGYLEKLGKVGINGVWMQAVLQNMAPSRLFSDFGKRSEERLENLHKLVQRARQFGVKIFLYLNEPRSMPPEFFAKWPDLKGAESQGRYAMCTSQPVVRQWISDSLAHIFARVPELGGVFSITMSENLTNCHARFRPQGCPRCSTRKSWEVVGEVLEAIRSGVRRQSRQAEVIAWDWGWPDDMCRNLIPKLPRDMRFQSVSEWSTPIERGGIKTQIGEYSISVVGPGPRATANWGLAKQAGVATMAKTQFNNTWEISAVPNVPAVNLVARHCDNLRRAGISGVQASWTLGGYPSPNLEVAKEFYFAPAAPMDAILSRVATRRYGAKAAPLAMEAWKGFSEAFEYYPYSVAIYTIPTQHGPANLLRAKPTGIKASMILFPQDDYKSWSGKYPPQVVQREFAKMADRWEQSLPNFRQAVGMTPAAKRERAQEDLAIAETCAMHFRSTANQVEFYILRDGPGGAAARQRMRAIAEQELELARRQYMLAKRHSVIAYEASNHYYYRPADLIEKIVSCRHLLDTVWKEGANG